jgi:hypothetical protein
MSGCRAAIKAAADAYFSICVPFASQPTAVFTSGRAAVVYCCVSKAEGVT